MTFWYVGGSGRLAACVVPVRPRRPAAPARGRPTLRLRHARRARRVRPPRPGANDGLAAHDDWSSSKRASSARWSRWRRARRPLHMQRPGDHVDRGRDVQLGSLAIRLRWAWGCARGMNFARDVVEAADPRAARAGRARRATARGASGPSARSRRARARARRRAATRAACGRGDVVLTLIGNRPGVGRRRWSPASGQGSSCCRAPSSCARRTCGCASTSRSPTPSSPTSATAQVLEAAGWSGADGLLVPDEALSDAPTPPPAADLDARRPVPDHVHAAAPPASRRPSCTASATSPASACRPSTGSARAPGDLVWCTAACGWSKSARNVFIAPWLRGAAALLHDARFDPDERLAILARERVDVLCMAPTEYRVIAKRARASAAARRCAALVAAGEALNPEVLRAWHEATGLWIRDGYGQTETGQLTGMPLGTRRRGPGSMGRAAAGRRAVGRRRRAGRRPGDRPDVLPRLPRRDARRADRAVAVARPATASTPGRRRLPALRGPHRRRDHLRRLPDRPVRGRVGARRPPRGRRGRGGRRARRRARRGRARRRRAARRPRRRPTRSPRELQDHVKAQTAPYKYPRIVDFAAELPKTASGKVRRAALR